MPGTTGKRALRTRLLGHGTARLTVAAVLTTAVLAGGWSWQRADDRVDASALVESSNGIYPGDEVRVLGVPVGRIDDITSEPGHVRIDFHYDADVKVPAEAAAAIVAPSLVSSRYLQLAPRYDGGATLDDGDVIPLERTASPVEWDEIKGQLNDLSVALGPRGANQEGALSRLLSSSADTLDGKGATINATIANLSKAVRTLQSGSSDTFSTVRNLQVFVGALAQSDVQIAEFIQRLDAVSGLLADNKDSLRTALQSLGVTVGKVEGFVRTNRGELVKTMKGLTEIAAVVARQQDHLAQALHVAPNALSNLIESYHSGQNAVAVDLQAANLRSPGQLVCGAVGGAAGESGADAADLCQNLLGNLLDGLGGSPQAVELLDFLKKLLGAL